MYERVNPSHPDKQADRIAGAIVDLAYAIDKNPRIAVEVLLGHGVCHVIAESSVTLHYKDIKKAIRRIAGKVKCDIVIVPQDSHLANNQFGKIRCGDNGIFKGMPVTDEQKKLTALARVLYQEYPYDGKFILDGDKAVICQSNAWNDDLRKIFSKIYSTLVINPLGEWTGGSDVDTGATNRKLGSDMGDSITGGGLWGKDCSKPDVSVNIYAFLKAQETGNPVEISCAIGDEVVDGKPYSEICEIARKYIDSIGGFEKFAEWGLIR